MFSEDRRPGGLDGIAQAQFNAAQSGALSDGGGAMTDLARMFSQSVAPDRSLDTMATDRAALGQELQNSGSATPQGMPPQPFTPTVVAPPPQPLAPPIAAPQAMGMIAPPQMAQFNITPASGAKPKNYQPAQMAFTPPSPTLLAQIMGRGQQGPAFSVTPSSGTRPRNFRPMQMTMSPPSPVGQQALMQILAMMRGPTNPFNPFGRG